MADPTQTASQKQALAERAARAGLSVEDYLVHEKEQLQRARCRRRRRSRARARATRRRRARRAHRKAQRAALERGANL